MTIIIDTVSEPGAWARAIGRGCAPSAVDYQPPAVDPDVFVSYNHKGSNTHQAEQDHAA